MQTIWFSPNLSDLVQGCLMQNFKVLASILKYFFNFLLEKGREKGRKEESKKEVSKGWIKDLELSICQKGKGRARNFSLCQNRMLILLCGKLLILI